MVKAQMHKILVTRPLSDEQVAYANALGLDPLIVPALNIEFTLDRHSILRTLDKQSSAVWVFTSQNGVEGLKRLQDETGGIEPAPPVFAVGEKTAGALAELGIEAATPEREDAIGLAELIIDEISTGETSAGTGSDGSSAELPAVLHWCGNLSRGELNEELEKAGFRVKKLEVYQTGLNAMRLPDESFEAVLFYSPSAVEAFRRSGGFERDLPALFAIGSTTAEALSLESGRDVQIPSKASTEALLEQVAAELTVGYKTEN